MSTESILQNVLSPKVVSDGSGGYTTKTDIVNVDNITATGTITTSSFSAHGGDLTLHDITATGTITSDTIKATGVLKIGDTFTITPSSGGSAAITGSIGLAGTLYGGNFGTKLFIGNDLYLNTGTLRNVNSIMGDAGINVNTLLNANGGLSGSFQVGQCGTGTFGSAVVNPLVTSSSIIIVTPISDVGGNVPYVEATTGSFTVTCAGGTTFNYFIAKF